MRVTQNSSTYTEEKVRAFLKAATSGADTTEAPAAASEPPVPSIEVATETRVGLPFAPWLFSRQNLPLKALAVAAILLVLASGGLVRLERGRLEARDRAWAELSGGSVDRPAAALTAAAAFLSHPPLRGIDNRETPVRIAYGRALVRATLDKSVDDAILAAHYKRFGALGGHVAQE